MHYIVGRKNTFSRIGTLYERIGENDTMEEVATGDVRELRKLAARLNASEQAG